MTAGAVKPTCCLFWTRCWWGRAGGGEAVAFTCWRISAPRSPQRSLWESALHYHPAWWQVSKGSPSPSPQSPFFLFIYIHSLPSLFPFILIWRIILLDDGQNNAHCWLVHWLSVLYKYATWEQQKDLVGNVRALMYLGQTPKCHNTPKINQLHFNLSSHNYPQSPQKPQEEQRIWTLRYTVFGVKEAA